MSIFSPTPLSPPLARRARRGGGGGGGGGASSSSTQATPFSPLLARRALRGGGASSFSTQAQGQIRGVLKMSCQKLSRQSLHLVLNEGRGLFSLRHMDVSKLFYPSTAEALEAEAKAKTKKNKIGRSIGRLPPASLYYQPYKLAAANPYSLASNVFAVFGESKNKILHSDAQGHTNVYNTESLSFRSMPTMHSPKGPNCLAAHITRTAAHARSDFDIHPRVDYEFFELAEEPHGEHTDSLYIIDMDQGCFEVLAYYPVGEWQWRDLPTPPPLFDSTPGERKACYAVIDGTRICFSSATGTYSFDTVDIEWSKVGDWALPFHNKGEYVPELNLWLGLSAASPSDLCALDLSAVPMDSGDVPLPPMAQRIPLDLDPPEGWSMKSRALVNLGSGRFCIATLCSTSEDGPQVMAFTGVDVVRPCGDDQQGGEEQALALHRVKHKSKCIVADMIEHVL